MAQTKIYPFHLTLCQIRQAQVCGRKAIVPQQKTLEEFPVEVLYGSGENH